MSNSNKTPASAVEKNENEIANRETEGRSQRQIIINRFVKHKAAMGSLFSLIFIIIFVFTATGMNFGPKGSPSWMGMAYKLAIILLELTLSELIILHW